VLSLGIADAHRDDRDVSVMRAVALACACACGRVGFDAVVDARAVGDGGAPADVAAIACPVGAPCYRVAQPGAMFVVTCSATDPCRVECSLAASCAVDCADRIDCTVDCPAIGCLVTNVPSDDLAISCDGALPTRTSTTATCP
jgi:hypothetical protein